MTKIATIENGSRPLRTAVPLGRPAPSARRLDAPVVFERAGPFEIRLAITPGDIRQAQRLRFRAFFRDGGAVAGEAAARSGRDVCRYDDICDHLIVVDTEACGSSGTGQPRLVGTYRLLRREIAERHGGFYSQGEFDLASLLARHPQIRLLELGRSCVHPDYRSKRVIELLWRGLYLYAQYHAVDALIGCASLPGTDLEANRLALSFLHHQAAAEAAWQVTPLKHCEAAFEPIAKGGVDLRRGLMSLPPLIKAYLRTGARFSTGVVIDRQFGTTDLFAVMPMADIEERYLAHYGQPSCLSGTPVA